MRHATLRKGAGPRAMLVALGILIAAGGCGGGASVPAGGTPILLAIKSDGGRDGFVRTDGFVRVVGNGPAAGDLDSARAGLGLRMFYSFPLVEIPQDAVITSVTLRVYQEGKIGQPYSGLGDLVVDHVNPGDSLDPSDFAGNTLDADIGNLSPELVGAYSSLPVGPQVGLDLIAGRERSWFRLRFSRDSNLDGGDDVVMLNDGEDSRHTRHLPLLEVIYVRR
jgi:hypothetical protein